MYTYQFISPDNSFQFVEHNEILDLQNALALLAGHNPQNLNIDKIVTVYILESTTPGYYVTVDKLK